MSSTATIVELQQLHGLSLRKIAGLLYGRPRGMRAHRRREHVAKGGGVCFANHFKEVVLLLPHALLVQGLLVALSK